MLSPEEMQETVCPGCLQGKDKHLFPLQYLTAKLRFFAFVSEALEIGHSDTYEEKLYVMVLLPAVKTSGAWLVCLVHPLIDKFFDSFGVRRISRTFFLTVHHGYGVLPKTVYISSDKFLIMLLASVCRKVLVPLITYLFLGRCYNCGLRSFASHINVII